MFAVHPAPSLLVLIASFFHPHVGLLSLAGCVIANLSAIWIGGNRLVARSGIYGVSGILVGLALGLNGEPGVRIWFFTLIGAALSGFLSVMIGARFAKKDLPILSIPFMLVIWPLLLTYGAVSGRTESFTALPFFRSIDQYLFDKMPLELFQGVRTFGDILFQNNFLSSLLVLVAIAIYSRISLFYGLWGAVVGLATHYYIHGSLNAFHGLNYVLTAMALGGFFLVAKRQIFPLVTLAIVAVGILDSSADSLFHALQIGGNYSLPTLALAFNLVTLLFLYPLKSAISLTPNPKITPIPLAYIRSAETNLRWADLASRSFQKTLLTLPVIGEWTIYQANDGELTHKGLGRYAWDFVVSDRLGSRHQGLGLHVTDFYAFGLPVVAPAAGVIVEAVVDLPDNPIGSAVTDQNWGNYVLINHWNGEYSKLAHFKQGGVVVAVGQVVNRGELLGYCGNSGRSAIPHLHYQLQSDRQLVSNTIAARFAEGMIDGRIEISINPALGQRVSQVDIESEAAWTLVGKEGEVWKYRAVAGLWKFEESLLFTTDAYGYPIVTSQDFVWYILDRPNFIELLPDYKTTPTLLKRSAWLGIIGNSLVLPKQLKRGLEWQGGRVVGGTGDEWIVETDRIRVTINSTYGRIVKAEEVARRDKANVSLI